MLGGPRRGVCSPGGATNKTVVEIRQRAETARTLDASELLSSWQTLGQDIVDGDSLRDHSIVCRCFGLATEAIRRATGKTLYDVQLAGALVLAGGAIAEIQTGEGKTLVTALPASLFALAGKGVHVATTSEYLSQRDFDEVEPALRLLGLQVGLLRQDANADEKRNAYACDITYGPGFEFGFDFLRDQLTLRSRYVEPLGARHLQRLRGIALDELQLCQRELAYAIVDEADSVLIDEATTPLVLGGPVAGPQTSMATAPAQYEYVRDFVEQLSEPEDFELVRSSRRIKLTTDGQARIEQAYSDRPEGGVARPWSQLVEQALRARHFLHRDIDYVVRDGQVLIVDQHTGRIHGERKWRSGLHQAVEVCEGLPPSDEQQTQARITRQRFCQLYECVAGMTGTARGGERELREFYRLPVVSVPTHRPCQRVELPTRWFGSQPAKIAAIAADTALRSKRKQPVLIGTRTIHDSRAVSEALTQCGIVHAVLNGLQDAEEAAIVAKAGQAGTVTVATNMAGRGTDIRLDEAARQTGGLHVIAAEYHESTRVDRQLAGRAARQGDPGSCQVYASADDQLLADHAPELADAMRSEAEKCGVCERDFTSELNRLQRQIEQRALGIRRRMVAQDGWLESVQASLAKQGKTSA